MSHKILVINSGSTSLKFSFFENTKCIISGEIEQIATPNTNLWVQGAINYKKKCNISHQKDAIEVVTKILSECDISTIDAVGHRIVFGGNIFDRPTIINKKVIQKLQTLLPYDPIHMPSQIENIQWIEKCFPKAVQVGCFDTSFHQSMPKKAKLFALPYSMYEKGIQRYGFHGLCFESIISNDQIHYEKIIIAHLGSGSSICAVKNNKSIDTSMGFTPLSGVPMMARIGDIDPGIFLFLLKQEKWTFEQLEKLIYKNSGLQGICPVSNMKTLLEKAKNSEQAQDAVDLFCYHAAKTIASYVASLKGLDAIIFSGGVGERSSMIRKSICSQLSIFNIHLDKIANQQNEMTISSDQSKIKVFVIPAQEEKIIAKHVMQLLFS